jgi:hypothetical protein
MCVHIHSQGHTFFMLGCLDHDHMECCLELDTVYSLCCAEISYRVAMGYGAWLSPCDDKEEYRWLSPWELSLVNILRPSQGE